MIKAILTELEAKGEVVIMTKQFTKKDEIFKTKYDVNNFFIETKEYPTNQAHTVKIIPLKF